ncbi:hypothetical protein CKM354_000425100 [Cercospora kikuchii]|uniref:Glutamyl-tRNA amidotransferase complex subunit Gta3 domain-containing protein n=1 Tax=Cercospora kikuchii TaxID=84275 RepID=A0A9P3CDT9_9PEZI|nr:uncharacterized protein CKM354_000425100 [Cercospora kikuchii]GIZ40931.1 hypothetical protein CKM354_000425100 [Cercospora kikuchii]
MAARIARRANGIADSLTTQRAAVVSQNVFRSYSQQKPELDIDQLLSRPTWSVSSLLPSSSSSSSTPEITPKQLHHLLRLSALPPPKDATEEQKMLSTLSSQLHFVKDIQQMDTTGVEPLRSLRDETKQGEKEAELGLDALKVALENEEIRGRWHKRIRRQRKPADSQRWDVLGCASKKVGRYFVVEGGKDG